MVKEYFADDKRKHNMRRRKGKKAIITGGSSMITLATAQLFERGGARAAINSPDEKVVAEGLAKLSPAAIGIAGQAQLHKVSWRAEKERP
jgi:NAD(P)-dependent dehydrogenase (short-subunit alcohol dehydrogenase family)